MTKNFYQTAKMKNDKLHNVLASLFIALAVFSPNSAVANEAPKLVPHSAYYDVKISVLKGYMLTYLSEEAEGFKATSEIRARGLARMMSKGAITGESQFLINQYGVQPVQYVGSNTIAKTNEHVTLNFDWLNKKLIGQFEQRSKDENSSLPVNEELTLWTHDALSLQYGLMHDLANNTLQAQYVLAEGDQLKTINIKQLDKQMLKVPFGEYEVTPIQHQAEGSSRVTTFWCAEALNYLPIMIEQYKGDKRKLLAVLGNYRLPPYK